MKSTKRRYDESAETQCNRVKEEVSLCHGRHIQLHWIPYLGRLHEKMHWSRKGLAKSESKADENRVDINRL